MTSKFKAWLNGKARDQYEVVKPVVTVGKFGPAGTRCTLPIGSRIDCVRSGGDSLRNE